MTEFINHTIAKKPLLSKNFDLGRTATLGDYGAYENLKKARAMEPPDALALVKKATLQGRGGAGFPAGMKWEFAANAEGSPKYLVCNADESEPGTFKDVHIMELDPHVLLEGMCIAAHAIGCTRGYIYIRGEFARAARTVEAAIAEAKDLIAPFEIYVHRGAGAYICGEETALLESLEGKIGQPRLKPPFPVTHGLWQKPTVVNNVETLSCLPMIIENGSHWWQEMGSSAGFGTKLFCISGDVKTPCVVETSLGIPLIDLINEYGGGTYDGREIQAVFPGGSSAPPLGPEDLDVPMDFKSVGDKKSMLGSAAVIVIDDSRCMVDVARNIMHFYEHESCGKCTPCGEGNESVHGLIKKILAGEGDESMLEYFEYMSKRVFDDCFCAFAKGSMWSFGKMFHRWRDDFEQHIRGEGCGRKTL